MYSPALLERLRKQGRVRKVSSSQPETPSSSETEPSVRPKSSVAATPDPNQETPRQKRAASSVLSSVPKRLITQAETQEDEQGSKILKTEQDQKSADSSETAAEPEERKDSEADLSKKKQKLLKTVAQKEEELRKLKLVKCYDSKHSLEDLDALTEKWLSVAQRVVEELWQMTPQQPKPTLGQFLDLMAIDKKAIGYNEESEGFE